MPVPCHHRSTPSTRRGSGTPSVSDGGESFEGVRGLTPPLPSWSDPGGGRAGVEPPLLLGAQKVLWVPGPPYLPPPFSPVQEKSEERNMRSILAKEGGNTRRIRKMKINQKKTRKTKYGNARNCGEMRIAQSPPPKANLPGGGVGGG